MVRALLATFPKRLVEKIVSPYPHHSNRYGGGGSSKQKKSTAVAMLDGTAYNYRLDILILTSFVQGGASTKKSTAVAMLGRSKWSRARSVATTPSNCGLASICNGHNSIASSPYPHRFQLNTGSVVRQNKKSIAVAMLGRTAYNY